MINSERWAVSEDWDEEGRETWGAISMSLSFFIEALSLCWGNDRMDSLIIMQVSCQWRIGVGKRKKGTRPRVRAYL